MGGDSILDTLKNSLGINTEDTHFDAELIMHINSIFMTLNQVDVGPEYGFKIFDNTGTWVDFLGTSTKQESVKTYTYLKLRLIFDPPANSFAVKSLETMATELEWRLNVQVEGEKTLGE